MKTLRKWQAEALDALEGAPDGSVIWAIMGSGKSIAISEICARTTGNIVVTAPTVDLVEQLSDTIAHWTGEVVGRFYTKSKSVKRITVVCHASLAQFTGRVPTIDLWIADEAHKTECDQVMTWAAEDAPKSRVGFTATPWRASESESLSLFTQCVYEYGPVPALRDGVVVMPRLVMPQTDGLVDVLCLDFIEGQDTPGVCNAANIEDAEIFGSYLRDMGVDTLVVHSQSGKDGRDAVRFLEQGGRRCAVYVNMLAEGFDCPAIQWLVARRRVGSRVRFAQEIGRGLRAYPGKTECLVYDPHGLFAALSLSYEACLGELPPQDDVIPVLDLGLVELELIEAAKKEPDHPRAIAFLAAYLYEIKLELQFRGVIEIKLTKGAAKKSASWRQSDATHKQLEFAKQVAKQAGKYSKDWPENIRYAMRTLWRDLPFCSKGVVSDVIDILQHSKQIAEIR